ncbi:MAG TPA: DUF4252 domain-containing protein [Flavobacteriaceae bacterium]|nr:DUF4252 domain-containing protein [Flavobacteriaceae bacterium]
MKNIVIAILLLGYSLMSSAQNLDKYEDMAEVNGVFITQHMFELLSKINMESEDAEEQRFVNLIENIDGLKVLTTVNQNIGVEMKTDVNAYIAADELEELMRVKKDGKSLKFYFKPGSSEEKVSQLFMFMTKNEKAETRYVLLSITGDIDLNDIGELTGKLKGVPGAEELKNVKPK